MRGKINKAAVEALKPGDILADIEVKGFVARRLPSGVITYGLRYRVAGRQRWLALGLHGQITPDAARRLAKKRTGEVADNRDPASEREAERDKSKATDANTVNVLLDTFLQRYVRAKGLRSGDEIERTFDKYVKPRIGDRSIYGLRRRDIVEMLDAIDKDHGPVMADRTLSRLRKAFNWQATRDDEFVPPLVIGMARTRTTERARKRILDDQEIHDLWATLDSAKLAVAFAKLVRALLLTAQRREEVARMHWREIKDKTWVIPAERYKTRNVNVVPLTDVVLKLLGAPRREGFVFSTTAGKKPFSGYSKAKRALDEAIAKHRKAAKRQQMPAWVLHDLRRTARSLMSRAGVESDIAERVLGHVIGGVRGVYDRHEYIAEKRDALERLSKLVAQILDPSRSNMEISGAKAHRASSQQLEPISSN